LSFPHCLTTFPLLPRENSTDSVGKDLSPLYGFSQ
jgi:hypothetical protein